MTQSLPKEILSVEFCLFVRLAQMAKSKFRVYWPLPVAGGWSPGRLSSGFWPRMMKTSLKDRQEIDCLYFFVHVQFSLTPSIKRS